MKDDTRVRCSSPFQVQLVVAMAAAFLFAGCGEPSRVLEAAASFAGEVGDAATNARELDASNIAAALNDEEQPTAGRDLAEPRSNWAAPTPSGPRTYYQFIDDSGSVRFVGSLDEVPEQWRDRAGTVELSSPPPARPSDRQADFERRKKRARAVLAAAEPARRQNDVDVQLYYADWCPYCRKAKAHLEQRGVDYELLDVDDPQIMAELKSRTGSGSIPVLDVGGEIVRGFDPSAIDRLLAKR